MAVENRTGSHMNPKSPIVCVCISTYVISFCRVWRQTESVAGQKRVYSHTADEQTDGRAQTWAIRKWSAPAKSITCFRRMITGSRRVTPMTGVLRLRLRVRPRVAAVNSIRRARRNNWHIMWYRQSTKSVEPSDVTAARRPRRVKSSSETRWRHRTFECEIVLFWAARLSEGHFIGHQHEKGAAKPV